MGKFIDTVFSAIKTFINDLTHADSDKIRSDLVDDHDTEFSSKQKALGVFIILLVALIIIVFYLWFAGGDTYSV